jgi:hypothetical protein
MGTLKLPGLKNPVDLEAPIVAGGHFTWAEATAYGSRIPQTVDFDGITIAASQITANIIKIATELETVRSNFGNCPIVVTSWYRPPAVNRAVGGVSNSQHLLGWGVDIQIHGLYPPDVADRLARTWNGGVGNNKAYTHLDLRHLMGWQAARWQYGRSA